LGADHLVVRVGLILLGLAGGAGIGIYLACWVLLKGRKRPSANQPTFTTNLGVALATASALFVVTTITTGLPDALLWSVTFLTFGLILPSPLLVANKTNGNGLSGGGGGGGSGGGTTRRRATLFRVGAGSVFVVVGLSTLLASSQGVDQLWRSMLAAVVVVGGLAMVFAPWWTQALADLDAERAERIRAEERSDLAAHLHDSVLQTLNLIQNRANEPQVTAVLARQQERELRQWLQGTTSSNGDEGDDTLRPTLENLAAEIEAQYLSVIECIVVGDVELTPPVIALVGATREALVNAGKFADSPLISLYAEVDDDVVRAFVRDRGRGFDPATVPEDRQGIRSSIHGRIERAAGSTTITSTPGQGTEVRIEVPM
jgi:signal transduction histidine kinase